MKKVARLVLMFVLAMTCLFMIGGATSYAAVSFDNPTPYWNEYHPGLISWKPITNATSYTVVIKYEDVDGTVKMVYSGSCISCEFDACMFIENNFGKDLYAEVKADDNYSLGISASGWGRTPYFINAKFSAEPFVDNWTAWKTAYKRIHGVDIGDKSVQVRYSPDIQPGTRNQKPVSNIPGASGWKLEGNRWYYVNENGETYKDRWVETNGYWYYVDSVGAMKFETWIEENGEKYWLDSSGIMATGWRHLGKNWYYFYPDGRMAKDCWVSSGSTIYYVKSNGKMHFGDIQYGDYTYYVNPETGCYGR